MKLTDIALVESSGHYITYKVSSPKSDSVYYGYCQYPGDIGDDDAVRAAVLKQFVTAAKRADDETRGSSKVLSSAGNESELKVAVHDVHVDELDAFNERNLARVGDPASINGPSMYPPGVFARAKKETPDKVTKWDKSSIVHLPADKAMVHPDSVYNQQALVKLRDTMDKKAAKQLADDLHSMKYPEFRAKYFR